MAKKPAAPKKAAAAKASPPVRAAHPEPDFNQAETLPVAERSASEATPARQRGKAATRARNPVADRLAETIGSPEGVNFHSENVTKIGTAHDARGKKRAVKAAKADEGDDVDEE